MPLRATRSASRKSPTLTPAISENHIYRCFFPVGSTEAQVALDNNIASGRVNAETGELVATF